MSTEEAIRCAIGIGAALHKIHSRGFVHGALSPYCIALESGGPRILQPTPSPEDCAAYRSPEQVRGEEPDVRSDVFAYGALVYEIACGKRAFPGDGAELSQRILIQPPLPLPAGSPILAAVEGVVAGCLQKDPAHPSPARAERGDRIETGRPDTPPVPVRLRGARPLSGLSRLRSRTSARAARDRDRPPPRPASAVRLAMPSIAPYSAQNVKASYGLSVKRRVWVIGAAILVLAATSVAAVMLLQRRPAAPVLKFAVMQPENTTYPGMSSVSPNGRYLTFSAVGPEGKRMLWLRPLDALHATVIQGSEGASAPFWSPDSQEIAFFGGKFLRKVKIAGGRARQHLPGGGRARRRYVESRRHHSVRTEPVRRLLPCGRGRRQARSPCSNWTSPNPSGPTCGRSSCPTASTSSSISRRNLPILRASTSVRWTSRNTHRLFASQTNAVYSAASPDTPKSGYLLYIHERNLMAQQFNAGKTEIGDEPVTLANDIGAVNSLALAPISVSTTGVLVYQAVGQPTRQMVWMDRAGRQIAVSAGTRDVGPSQDFAGREPRHRCQDQLRWQDRAPVAARCQRSLGTDFRRADARRFSRLVARRLAHRLLRQAGRRVRHLHARGLPGSKSELVLKNDDKKFPSDWSHDGKYIAYSVEGAGTRLDMWGVSLGDRKTAPILDTVYAEGFATLSPDGKWIAYQSDQSGRNEVYVQAFDGLNNGTKRRWMVSNKGGGLPRWRFDSSRTVLYDDGRPRHECSASRHRRRRDRAPDNRRCSSRHDRFPKPGTSTTSRPMASASLSTFRWSGPAPRRSRSSPTGPKS